MSGIDYEKWRLPIILGALVLIVAVAAGLYFSSTTGPTEAKTFATPDDAAKAFVTAARTHDAKGLEALLGPESKEAIESGDPVEDRAAMDKFVAAYDMKSMLVQDSSESISWHVGNDDWTLPIPIVMKEGRWQFDPDAGYEEIINRRIGRNESNTIEAVLAYVDAQREYAMVDRNGNGLHEYALRFISTPGTQDGLYWPVEGNEPPSPLGDLFAEATAQGYGQEAANTQKNIDKNTASDVPQRSNPYYGYYYKILTSQGADAPGGALDYMVNGKLIGGFALVAYPADYGVSGIKTFLVNYDGIVYQKDLGPDTDSIADKITAYNPDSSWEKADVPTN